MVAVRLGVMQTFILHRGFYILLSNVNHLIPVFIDRICRAGCFGLFWERGRPPRYLVTGGVIRTDSLRMMRFPSGISDNSFPFIALLFFCDFAF